jgi:hypothetical protein
MKITKEELKQIVKEEWQSSTGKFPGAETFRRNQELDARAMGYKDLAQKRVDDPRPARRKKAERERAKVAAVAAELAAIAAAEEAGDTPAPLEEPAVDPGSREYMYQLQKEINKAKNDKAISVDTWRKARRALRGDPGITGSTPRAVNAERARAILDAGYKHSAAAPVRESFAQENKTMKITKENLEQIVKEELSDVLRENKAINNQIIVNINKELDKVDAVSLKPGTIEMLKGLIKGYLTGRLKRRSLKGLRGSKPLKTVERSVAMTGAKG